MATNAGHMTKLEAVNDMLWSIGESPVQSLASGLGDAAIAQSILDRTNREIQLKGWQVNTQRGVVLTKNTDDQFALPVDTLRVDTVDPTGFRKRGAPPLSATCNVSMRRSADNTKFILYDVDNSSETWDTPDQLTVDIVKLVDFEKLTPALQMYVWTKAAHRFQKGGMGSKVLYQFTSEDVLNAETQAVQEDTANEDLNVIRDNPHVFSVAFRYNPNFGR